VLYHKAFRSFRSLAKARYCVKVIFGLAASE
jgi:hypothetical protein